MKRFFAFALLYISAALAGLYAPPEWRVVVWLIAATFITLGNMICMALEAILEAAHGITGEQK